MKIYQIKYTIPIESPYYNRIIEIINNIQYIGFLFQLDETDDCSIEIKAWFRNPYETFLKGIILDEKNVKLDVLSIETNNTQHLDISYFNSTIFNTKKEHGFFYTCVA